MEDDTHPEGGSLEALGLSSRNFGSDGWPSLPCWGTGFFFGGVVLIRGGSVSQLRGADRKWTLSSRCSKIWVGMKTRGSVSIVDKSRRTKRNGGRDILEQGMELGLGCGGLSFVKVRGEGM